MAATIQSLFPYSIIDPAKVTIYPRLASFEAPVIGGEFVFNETTTPPVNFGKVLQGEKGVIAGLMLSANCAESDFTTNVIEPLQLQVIHGGNLTPVNMAGFPFSNFSQAENFELEWKDTGVSTDQEEEYFLSVNGRVNQIPGITSNVLKLDIVFNFIRIYEGIGEVIDEGAE